MMRAMFVKHYNYYLSCYVVGVVFDLDEKATDDSLPTHVKFTIRVDTARTDSTRRVKDR